MINHDCPWCGVNFYSKLVPMVRDPRQSMSTGKMVVNFFWGLFFGVSPLGKSYACPFCSGFIKYKRIKRDEQLGFLLLASAAGILVAIFLQSILLLLFSAGLAIGFVVLRLLWIHGKKHPLLALGAP